MEALKFRFNECEGRGFNFKALKIKKVAKGTHKVYTREELEDMRMKLRGVKNWELAFSIQYDFAARIQDLAHLRYDHIELAEEGGISRVNLIPLKSSKRRVVILSR